MAYGRTNPFGVWTDQPLPTAYSSDFRSPSEDSRVSLGGGGIAGGGTEIRFNLTITTTANPSPREPPPYPTVAAFKVDSQVSAYGTVGQVDNGFDNPKVVSSSGSVSQSGLNLVQAPVSGGIATFTRTVSGSSNGYGVGLSYRVTGDNRSVRITSPTFFDAQGKNWAKYGYSGTPNGVVRQENERKPDGSIIVDSLAQPYSLSSFIEWKGGGKFTANVSNFNLGRTLKWKLSGGTPEPAVQFDMDSGYRVIPDTVTVPWIKLGGTEVGGPQTRVSALNLKATDTDGVTGENTFTVNWHQQYENWKYQSTQTVAGSPVTLTDVSGSPAIAQGASPYWTLNSKEQEFDLGGTAGKASAWIGVATTGLSFFPETAPIGWLIKGGTLLTAAAGAVAVQAGSPPSPTAEIVPGYTIYDSYKNAVTKEKNGQIWPSGAKYFAFLRRSDDTRTNLDTISNVFVTNTTGAGDPYWEGTVGYHLHKKGQLQWKDNTETWGRDEFSASGYVGEGTAKKKFKDAPTPEVTWVLE